MPCRAAASLPLALRHQADGPEGGRPSPSGFVCLTVTDTGEGMDEKTAKACIEPFFTTKEPGKGSGLGLSMVHGLAEQSGGWMRIVTAPGQGTRISIALPVAEPGVGRQTGAGPARGSARFPLLQDPPGRRRCPGGAGGDCRSGGHGASGHARHGRIAGSVAPELGRSLRPCDHRLCHARHDRAGTGACHQGVVADPAGRAGDRLCRTADRIGAHRHDAACSSPSGRRIWPNSWPKSSNRPGGWSPARFGVLLQWLEWLQLSRQWASSTGTFAIARIWLVAPPKIICRSLLWV